MIDIETEPVRPEDDDLYRRAKTPLTPQPAPTPAPAAYGATPSAVSPAQPT